MELRRAQKQKAKLRIGMAGTSGSGKTYSALLMASGMTSWDKIAIIDTENGSADLYANLGEYNVITLKAPFSPERYIEAIKACEDAGMEVIIVDSITHEWDGTGGCLEIIEEVTKASMSKNSYTAWAKVTPRHNAFVQAILQSPCHVITTVRRKQDYSMDKDSNGKTTVTKAGLKEITRDGFEYELTLSFALTINHLAEASKDRTGMFMDKPEFRITPDTGKELMKWADEGSDVIATTVETVILSEEVLKSVNVEENKSIIDGINDPAELKEFYLMLKSTHAVDDNMTRVRDLVIARNQVLTKKAEKLVKAKKAIEPEEQSLPL